MSIAAEDTTTRVLPYLESGDRLTRAEFEDALSAAGLVDIEIDDTHRVHEHASSAIVRARKPATA